MSHSHTQGSSPYSLMPLSANALSGPITLNSGNQFKRRWSGLIPQAFMLVCLICQLVTASKETDWAMIVINLNPAVMQALCYLTAALAGISIFIGLFFVADTTGQRSHIGSCCTGGFVLVFALVVAVIASLIVHYWNQAGGKYICGDLPACQDAKAGMTLAWVSFGAVLFAEISWCLINKRATLNVTMPASRPYVHPLLHSH